jgi:hypothetical protein
MIGNLFDEMECISSVLYSDRDILIAIKKLYLDGEDFDLDPCFSKGKMYEDLPLPKIKMDKTPQNPNVIKNDIVENGIPLENESIRCVIFDPPFMFGKHGKTDQNEMTKRFTMFDSWEDLEKMYKKSLSEFYRILKKGGIVAFKCQDYTDNVTTLTHCFVHNWALEIGFRAEDIFIKVHKGGRIWNSKLKQKHSRKFHTYWLVFRK